ncbi:MAG: hypothetical protein GY834_16720 [Bacteroidetes bacterium]|nr:hypothetical protein [Bacteroidota bacterium]
MASIQSKKAKSGKMTYYVVVCIQGKHKWLKAGTKKDATQLKKQIESMENSKRIEKLGIVSKSIRIDLFFQEYADHAKLRTSASTLKRYLGVLNTFIVFLKMFHPHTLNISQIKVDHIESYQKQRLSSVELKTTADGEKQGNHKNKRLPLPQTVNFEVCVLRSAFLWAYDRELISSVPTKKIKPLRVYVFRQFGQVDIKS